ncbi:hypothetical protein Ancab_002179, partial [Ancistrocladus abbreviatus]
YLSKNQYNLNMQQHPNHQHKLNKEGCGQRLDRLDGIYIHAYHSLNAVNANEVKLLSLFNNMRFCNSVFQL